MCELQPKQQPTSLKAHTGEGAFTLVEMLVAFGVLALTMVGLFSSFTFLNGYAAVSRNQSSAKALCQQRIEQVLSLPFHPPLTVPVSDGFYLLGQASNWTAASGPYTNSSPASFTGPAAGIQTSSETVSIYVAQDGTTVQVPGTRTTTVACTNTALNLAQFTVRVAYVYRSKSYSYAMYVLRGAD